MGIPGFAAGGAHAHFNISVVFGTSMLGNGGQLISLKKYLELDPGELKFHVEPDPGELLAAGLLAAYRALLAAVGGCGQQASLALDFGLEKNLARIGEALSVKSTASDVQDVESRAETRLRRWAEEIAGYLKLKAEEVKGLLMLLVAAAEANTGHSQRYENRFGEIATRLESIASLEDLGRIRSSLVAGIADLRSCTRQMNHDSRTSVAELKAEIKLYQNKLEMAETLAARDSLTGLLNRRSVEDQLQQRLKEKQPFCLLLIDLDGFKEVNDEHGHLAGDSCLSQFAVELRQQSRAKDTVGRWGGDEFVVVLDGGPDEAQSYIERVKQWVFGSYTVELNEGPRKVNLWASIGMARSTAEDSMATIIERADADMYERKRNGTSIRERLASRAD